MKVEKLTVCWELQFYNKVDVNIKKKMCERVWNRNSISLSGVPGSKVGLVCKVQQATLK